jgi:hypothetical protein
MSKIEVDAIEPQSGTTLTIGASGDSVNIASGATITDFTSTGIDDNATSTAITINSSENVGIGETSPGTLLDIKGVAGANNRITFNTTDAGINGNVLGGFVAENQTDSVGQITVRRESAVDDGYIVFETQATGGVLAERMRIDSSGNVGIGTSSPSVTLDVTGTNNSLIKSKTTTSTGIGGFEAHNNTGTSYLKVFQLGSAYGGTTFGGVTGNDQAVIEAQEVSSLAFTTQGGTPDIIFAPARTARMTIKNGGNVGIGTTTPSAKLSVSGTNSDTYGQLNVVSTGAGADAQISFSTPLNGRGMYVDDSATNAFKIYAGAGKGAGGEFVIDNSGNVTINGSLSKSSGSFRIPHPIKPETHQLVHSFVEAPQADNIYRGKVELVDGRAEVNIDTVASMTEGTFVALNREVQCFTSNESDWDAVRGSVTGNILTIECQNAESTATISWLVIGERQDQHMYDTDWTDENGKVIVEPLKETEE